MPDPSFRTELAERLRAFASEPLEQAALGFWEALGYHSERRIPLAGNTPAAFLENLDAQGNFRKDRACFDEWRSVAFLFQLTDAEIRATDAQLGLFHSEGRWDETIIDSYLFLTLELRGADYPRSRLAAISREVNRLFTMPVLLLFRHGETLTLSVVNRRLHRRDESRDVLEKVTLIKDIRFQNPHRAHLDILGDLALSNLHAKHGFQNFVGLHRAWASTLDTSELNRRFFRELADWYFWAVGEAVFPGTVGAGHVREAVGAGQTRDPEQAQNVIRLITRLVFCWFLKEKGLIPEALFDERRLAALLHDLSPESSSYYKAVLQNLFFATLNQEMGKRGFRRDGQNFMAHGLYRYRKQMRDAEELLRLFSGIPFLNGGLFECLDKNVGTEERPEYLRLDGFSDRDDNPLHLPNDLFFGEERTVDLSATYGEQRSAKVRGLIRILERYKFTVAENTPIEEEIALDPELLGQVFEELLAHYNPETSRTARKETGSFYTPRRIVHLMVDEALKAHFRRVLAEQHGMAQEDADVGLDILFAYTEKQHAFTEDEVRTLIRAVDECKVLDPACGSGAFPMGVLQRLVVLLGKLDPGNAGWKARQLEKAAEIPDPTVRDQAMADIEQAFAAGDLDYGRKLYLIENGIYGVDLQPVAAQIAKLRCFISLVVEQPLRPERNNLGIRPLPNLETKFVAANTLTPVNRPNQVSAFGYLIREKEAELSQVRHLHFTAKTPATKRKHRQRDAELRTEIATLLQSDGWNDEVSQKLAAWDPYDQNASADFFDPEWMFGLTEGFEVVLANPPYVRQEAIRELKPKLQQHYECYTGTADLYVYFYERSVQLLREGGVLCFISSNKFFRSDYGKKLRGFLAERLTLHRLLDFGDAPVFKAIAYPAILLGEKAIPPQDHRLPCHTWTAEDLLEDVGEIVEQRSLPVSQVGLQSGGWQLEGEAVLRLLDKLRAAGTPLGEYVGGRFYRGVLTGRNDAFIVNRETRDRLITQDPNSAQVLKPFLRGKDVKRWRVEPQDLWLLFIPWHFPLHEDQTIQGASSKAEVAFQQQYPAVYQHLLQFKDKLSNRNKAETGIRYEWYALQRCAATYHEEFSEPKIVMPAIERECAFATETEGFFSNDKTNIVVSPEASFLCAILNSAVHWWMIRKLAASKQGGYFEFKPMYVSQLPIPPASPEAKAQLAELAERAAGAEGAELAEIEDEINRIVFGLFGPTEEEEALMAG